VPGSIHQSALGGALLSIGPIGWAGLLNTFTVRLFPHLADGATPATVPELATELRTQPVVFCIGPEGDFSPAEVELARSLGYREVSLGHTRLRAETAALYCLGVNKAYKGA